MGRRIHRLALASLYLLFLGTAAYFAWDGASYYTTPLIERPRHPQYWQLKPGGERGLLFGIAGASMMVVMLLYSVRKRVPLLRRAGQVGIWLDYHILLGVCGPVFILLHSSFKVGGLVALSFWSMVAVALSGVVGRYLYRQIPRSCAGDELTLAEVETLDSELSQELVERHGLDPEALAELDAAAQKGVEEDRSLTALLLLGPFERWRLRRRLVRFRRRHPGLDRAHRRRFEKLVRRKALLRRRVAMWERLRRLFHYWHVFHKPFALIMYLFMIVHITVAWFTGYGWIGSG